LMKAQPVIDTIKSILEKIGAKSTNDGRSLDNKKNNFKIILLAPSKTVFDQNMAHLLAEECEHILLICGRYEGVDYRVEERCRKQFGERFEKVSLGKYVTLG